MDEKRNPESASTRAGEPALRFPQGAVKDNYPFEGGLFTGRVPMTSIGIELQGFQGVDLRDIRELALVFYQTPSGSIYINDVEFVR
jgi:hypothetical protein